MSNIIQCKSVTKRYKDVLALNNMSLQVPNEGCIVGLLGPNGSGKTTLIKILTGLLQPNEGEVLVCDKKVGVETKARVSYLSDAYSLFEHFTVKEQMDYYIEFFYDFNKEKALKMFNELGIDINKKIKTLSKGNKEKVSLIFTLARDAELYILDEPIAGVDPAARDYILQTIIAMKNANSTLLISTHLISEIEEYFDYIIFLKEGKIVLDGHRKDIVEREGKTIDSLFREVFRWM